eukprot:g82174.t1
MSAFCNDNSVSLCQVLPAHVKYFRPEVTRCLGLLLDFRQKPRQSLCHDFQYAVSEIAMLTRTLHCICQHGMLYLSYLLLLLPSSLFVHMSLSPELLAQLRNLQVAND